MQGDSGHSVALNVAWSRRVVIRRIPDLKPGHKSGQEALFDIGGFHADPAATVTPDKTPRGHPIIEQIHADLESSALAPKTCPRARSLRTEPGSCWQ